eukprot:TRINITY_DN3299_c0_g1_i7.p2 TRINITY_DN3299_c0_g1~~TRINITY_DN3299_c0_g1_i7.p2  ORF type:complete len:540 (-),score=83.02 TRINITY_DN3299_c0_g1_i7:91-1512(-)
MASTNLQAFTSGTDPLAAPGCSVPAPFADWNTVPANANQVQSAAGLAAANCAGIAGGAAAPAALNLAANAGAAIAANNGNYKGIEIKCDTANNYWPTNGFEGTQVCQAANAIISAVGGGPSTFIPSPTVNQAYWTSGIYQALTGTGTLAAQQAAAWIPQFSGTNALQCTLACTQQTNICTGGVYRANIVKTGQAELTGCRVKPTRANVQPVNIVFQCQSHGYAATPYTVTCNRDSTAAATTAGTLAVAPAYTGQCGAVDGAQSNARVVQENNDLPVAGATESIPTAGQVEGFSAANGVLSAPVVITNFAADNANNLVNRRSWNANPAQTFTNGVIYDIAVAGCETEVTVANRNACVQRTLNYIRCERDFPFQGATCYANNIVIPCPNHELGFRCPSSSKKGLLGLLGLIGIPLILLPLCLLFLCCIRRKKTEPDVHFATFDPLGAPAQHTATAVPTAFAATPFATAPSACPVL